MAASVQPILIHSGGHPTSGFATTLTFTFVEMSKLLFSTLVLCCVLSAGCATPRSTYEVNGKGADSTQAASRLMAEQANAALARMFPTLSDPPRLLNVVAPAMTRAAIAGDFTGTVVAELNIASDGHVTTVKIIESPSSALSEIVVDALGQWVFRPLVVDGEAKAFKVRQYFNYRIAR
jgi:outer membrane biosynthesis protein TonB